MSTLDNVQSGWHIKVEDEFTRYTDDLPEGIMGKVSVLTMVDSGIYVDDVGYRAGESMFYVTK